VSKVLKQLLIKLAVRIPQKNNSTFVTTLGMYSNSTPSKYKIAVYAMSNNSMFVYKNYNVHYSESTSKQHPRVGWETKEKGTTFVWINFLPII
jgi:hypothetical protein